MKKSKLKQVTLMVLVILIIMVGFFGVYSMSKGHMVNNVKDYSYMTNLNGTRVVNLELSSETKTVVKDGEGNIIKNATDDEIIQKGYFKEEEPANKEEDKNYTNFDEVRNIIKSRLDKLGVSDYKVRVDYESGNVVLELPENDNTDNIINIITTIGKFEIVDSESGEVLITKDDISASNVYRNRTESGVELSFSIEFNGEGSKKFEEITTNYKKLEDDTTSSSDITDETEVATAETDEMEIKETTETAETESEELQKEKKVTLKLDDTELLSTNFEAAVTTGKMYLTVGQAATTNEDARSNYVQAQKMATLLSTKTMPLNYENNSSSFVQSTQSGVIIETTMIAVAIVIAAVIIILTLKYKAKGLISGICYTGLVALLLLTVRYWNVSFSFEGIVGLFLVMFLNAIFVNKILKSLEEEKDNKKADSKHVINMAIKDNTIKAIPLFIIAVIFAFAGWEAIESFGMVMFWGLTLTELYNLLITKYILK